VRRSHLTARLKGDELTPKQEFNNGEVSEWLKEHAWKVCIRQRIEGSNPSLTAIFKTKKPYEIHRVFSFLGFARRPLMMCRTMPNDLIKAEKKTELTFSYAGATGFEGFSTY
jgi:hypothetical protein